MIQLKDIIQYYIGQPVYLCDNLEGKAVIEPLTAKMLAEDFEMFYDRELQKPYELMLRKLEDMTEDEWIEIENETSIIPEALGIQGLKESFLTMDVCNRFHWTIVNEALIALRKKGIDVDGLIDRGEAVDQKNLNQKA